MGGTQSIQRSATLETTRIADHAVRRSYQVVEDQTRVCNAKMEELKNIEKQMKDLEGKKNRTKESINTCLDVRDRMKVEADKMKGAYNLGNLSSYYGRNRNPQLANRPYNGGGNRGMNGGGNYGGNRYS